MRVVVSKPPMNMDSSFCNLRISHVPRSSTDPQQNEIKHDNVEKYGGGGSVVKR